MKKWFYGILIAATMNMKLSIQLIGY